MSLCRIVHPNAKKFITFLHIVGSIADEGELLISSDKTVIKALDPAKISLIEITMPSSAFIEYEVSREVSIGLNLSSLVRSIPKPKKTDKATLTVINDEFYEFILENDIKRRYKFRSIEVSAVRIPELDLDFKVKATILSSALRDAIKDLEDSEGIEFIADPAGSLLLKASDLNAQVKLSKTSGSLIELDVREPSKTTYDTDYLTKITELLSVSDMVELSYGNELPLSISFRLADDTLVKYLLAPKA